MKKKILSLLLAITLIFGVLPMSAFADEPNAEPKTDIIDIIGDTVDDPVEDQTDPVEDPTKDPTEDQTDDPTDNTTNTINATNGGGMILVDSGDGCTCDSFCDDPDCVVCKDDPTQCDYYYCICEAVCAEGEANPDCPVCKDDYSKCAQAVTAPQIAPMSGGTNTVDVTDIGHLNTAIENFNSMGNTNDFIAIIKAPITIEETKSIAHSQNPNLTFTIEGEGNLAVNMITRGSFAGNLFNVSNGSTLILKDIVIDGNGTNAPSDPKSLVLVSNNGTLIMRNNAALRNNIVTGPNFGGGVNVNTNGTFNMTGGTITENVALGGGGVYVHTGGTFNMSGNATITNNVLGQSSTGGGVYVNGGAFEMSGNATITNNTAINGGGVCVSGSGGAFTMYSGMISTNTASSGAGVSVDGGTFIMDNGTISGNTSSTYGGGVINIGTFTMNGGIISANTASTGGGVANLNNTFTMSGDASIDDNTAATNGGGVFFNNGTFNMSGTSSITGNTAGNNGGGVWASRSITSFTVKDSAQITCGVYLDGSNLPPSGSPGRTPGGSSAKITLAGTLNPIASIGIEGMGVTDPGTIVATNATASDMAKFFISNASGKIGDNNGFTLSGTNIVLGTAAPPAPTPSSGGGSSKKEKPAPAPSPWLDPTPAQNMSSDAKQKDSDLVRTKSSDLYGVRKDAWQKLKGYRFVHDTMDGDTVGVRVSINEPEKIKQDLLVSGYVKGASANSRKAQFEKWFNNKIHVIHFDQNGAWGQPVGIAAKIDPNQFDSLNNLFLYSYDSTTGKYTRIERQSNHWLDNKGYLHFTTELAGDIIISEGPLEKK